MRDVQYEYEAEAKDRTEGLAEGKSKEKLDTAKRLLQMVFLGLLLVKLARHKTFMSG